MTWVKVKIPEPARAMILAAAVGAAMTACATFPRTYSGNGVRLHVHNESWSAVDVSASINGEILGLGSVDSNDYPFFELDLPKGHPAEVVLIALSDRDGPFRSDTLAVEPGSVLVLLLDRRWDRSRWLAR